MLKIDPIKIANIKIITNTGNLTLAFSLLEMLKNIINGINQSVLPSFKVAATSALFPP